MKKRTTIFASICLVAVFAVAGLLTGEPGTARRPAIVAGADRVMELQRTDAGWEGTWYWYVGSTYNATNLTGVTALGLLEAFCDVKDPAYLDAAIDAAGYIMTHLGAGATGTQHWPRLTAPDVVFLYRLSQVTGDSSYATRAAAEWANLTISYPTAGALDAIFRSINRPSTWDIAFFLEAAHLSGDSVWADDAAAILANIQDTFYYGEPWWYALNVAGSIRALVECGYYAAYQSDIHWLLSELISLTDDDNGVGGWVQDSAYAALAYNSMGGAARKYANSLAKWLASRQEENGGWMEAGYEYPEIDGEAVRALSCSIGSNVTLDGFEPGAATNSSWRRSGVNQQAVPFNGQ